MEPHVSPESTPPELPLPRPRFYERVPWRRVVGVMLILSLWVVIGLVCSPTDFRF
jgi:hypothetical protein